MDSLLHLCCWLVDVESWNWFQFIQSSSCMSQAPPTDHRHLTNTHLWLWIMEQIADSAGVTCARAGVPYSHRRRAPAPTPDWLYLPPLLSSVCRPPAPPTPLAMTSLPPMTSSPWSGSRSRCRSFPSARPPSAWPLHGQRQEVIKWPRGACERFNTSYLSDFLGWFSSSPPGWTFGSLRHSALLHLSSSWSDLGWTTCQPGKKPQQQKPVDEFTSVCRVRTRKKNTKNGNILVQWPTNDPTQGNSKRQKHKNRRRDT